MTTQPDNLTRYNGDDLPADFGKLPPLVAGPFRPLTDKDLQGFSADEWVEISKENDND